MDFLKSFAVLSVCLQLSGGEKINSTMFAGQSGTSDVLSTKHQLFSSNQPSVVACASQCYHESACVSFSFTGRVKQPGNCGGHSKTTTPSDAKTGAVTFGLLETAAWRMQNCSSVVDCGSIPHVDCLQHKCVCTPGYVYSESLNRCIDAWRMHICSSVVDCGSIPDVDCHQHKCVCTPGYFYSESLNRCSDAWRMQICSSVVDCGSIPDVDCHQHKCVCTPGYFYSESLNRCIDDCPVPYLTAGFLEYYDVGITGYNIRTLYVDADGCKQACVQETDFTCLNAEWDFTNDRCNLANVTALSASWDDDEGWIFWQRNCL